MGLLSRAGNRSVSIVPLSNESALSSESEPLSLDEMGKALLERLRRLPQQKSTALTLLTLLKAYGSFQAASCLSLKDGVYTAYASVGFGSENLVIPAEKIRPEEHSGKKFFKLNSGIFAESGNPEMPGGVKNCTYWAFPLDERTLMLLSEDSSAFNPEPVSVILEEVAQKIIPVEEQPSQKKTETTLEEQISRYNKMYAAFNCIILEIPGADEDRVTFLQKVTEVVGVTGTVLPLPSGRPLILLPGLMDGELIAHRLSKTLNTRPLLSFNAGSPESVLEQLHSLA